MSRAWSRRTALSSGLVASLVVLVFFGRRFGRRGHVPENPKVRLVRRGGPGGPVLRVRALDEERIGDPGGDLAG